MCSKVQYSTRISSERRKGAFHFRVQKAYKESNITNLRPSEGRKQNRTVHRSEAKQRQGKESKAKANAGKRRKVNKRGKVNKKERVKQKLYRNKASLKRTSVLLLHELNQAKSKKQPAKAHSKLNQARHGKARISTL